MTAPISEELLRILADPETHEPLTLATDSQLDALRARIRDGAKLKSGAAAPTDFEAALLSHGNRVAYFIHEGVPNLLIDDRLELPSPL